MFNLQGSEIIFILLLALVVLGPEKLPGAIKRAMQTYAELRKLGSGFQDEFKSAIDQPMREMRETADLMKNQIDPKKFAEEAEHAVQAAVAADHADAELAAAADPDAVDRADPDAADRADPDAGSADAVPDVDIDVGDFDDPFDDPIDEIDDPIDAVDERTEENAPSTLDASVDEPAERAAPAGVVTDIDDINDIDDADGGPMEESA